MLDTVLIPAFWSTATSLATLIVPIVGLYLIMRLISDLLLGEKR